MRAELNGLVPEFIPWANALLDQARVPVRVTSARRYHVRQAMLHRRQASGHCEGCFGVAPVFKSAHEYGWAWDMIAPLPELERLGRIWQRWGGLWGGAVDPIHFEGTRKLLGASRTHELL